MGLALAEGAEQLEQKKPKADKERGHEGRRIRSKPNAAVQLGRIGRRLTRSEATMAMGSALAEAAEQLEP